MPERPLEAGPTTAVRRVRAHERFGPLTLELEVLADLDEAVDQLALELERRGLTRDPASFDLCPYFGVVWPSARALAGVIAAQGQALAGCRVLELGCGLGAPSIVAAREGARVIANDFHPDVPALLAINTALNGVTLDYVAHDWRRGPLPAGEHELVLASDLLYDASHAEPLAQVIARHTAPGGRALLADPGRPHLEACVDALGRLGFTAREEVHRVPPTRALGAGTEPVDVFVIELGRARSPDWIV